MAKWDEPDEVKELVKGLNGKQLILVTAHRRENFGQPMEDICNALKELASREDVHIVYPVHLNPNVQEPVNRILKGAEQITLLPPLDYLPLVHLMKHAKLILTDSGGIQEEAPAFGVPVLVMRETTERPEESRQGRLSLSEQKPVTSSRRRSDFWMIQQNMQRWQKHPIHLVTDTRQSALSMHF